MKQLTMAEELAALREIKKQRQKYLLDKGLEADLHSPSWNMKGFSEKAIIDFRKKIRLKYQEDLNLLEKNMLTDEIFSGIINHSPHHMALIERQAAEIAHLEFRVFTLETANCVMAKDLERLDDS